MKTIKWVLRLTFGLMAIVYLAVSISMFFAAQTDPAEEAFPALMYTFGGAGLLFLALAVFVPWLINRGERKRQDLLSWGLRVPATVVDIRPNYSVRVNRRHPWTVYAECIHPISREKVLLHSHAIWNCTVSTGQTVDIAFDQMNEKRFAFDIPETEGSRR